MNPWRPFPLIRLLLPIIAGIVTGLLIRNEIHIPAFAVLCLLLLLGILVFIKSLTPNYQKRWITGLLIFILLYLVVYENTTRHNDLFDKDYFIKRGVGRQYYLARILEPVVEKQKTTKTVIRVISVNCQGAWYPVKGKALVYFQKDFRSGQLFYGDHILFRTEFTKPQSAGFPYSFDQKRFLNNQHIYYSCYVNAVSWKKMPYQGDEDLLRIALKMRNRLLQILRDNHVQGREFAVTAALLLGYVDEIDRELIKDYSATGAMHILSVSGMHVGIIFLVLEKILGFLRKEKYGGLIKTGLILLMIWFYAMLTGLSPAVLRASVMISLVAIGKTMRRQPDILNILASSFIGLLIFEPTLLLNVGFQLSYLAVAGIVLLYKPIYDLYITSNYLIDKIWSVAAVSIAAQIITFPLSLYYFHQFPNYFMITNILVVPLSSLVIYTGIALLISGTVPVLSFCLARILVGLVWFLNHSIHFIEEMPFALTEGVYFNLGQVVCIYLILSTFFIFILYKRRMFIFLFFVFSICLSCSFLFNRLHQLGQKKIIVYGAKNLPAFDFISGETGILLYDPKVRGNLYFGENHQSTCSALGTNNTVKIMLTRLKANSPGFSFQNYFYKNGGFIQFYEKRICILSRKLPDPADLKIHLDYLILSENPDVTIEQILRVFEVKVIIIDPSNSRWRSVKWKAEAIKNGVKIHVADESGAYVVDLGC